MDARNTRKMSVANPLLNVQPAKSKRDGKTQLKWILGGKVMMMGEEIA
jgi:hypothetical protein